LRTYSILARYARACPCPPMRDIEEYVAGVAEADVERRVTSHLADCEACRTFVELMRVSQGDVAEMVEEEERRFVTAQAEERGRGAAEALLKILLPGRPGLFETVWESSLKFFEGLSRTEPRQWPQFERAEQLAGAMGFAGRPTGEVTAGVIASMTVLGTAWELAVGKIEESREEVRQEVTELAGRLGAGGELRGRLAEALPDILIRED